METLPQINAQTVGQLIDLISHMLPVEVASVAQLRELVPQYTNQIALVPGVGSYAYNSALGRWYPLGGSDENYTAAQLRDRSSHTGEQPLDSITGLRAALDSITGLSTALDSIMGLSTALEARITALQKEDLPSKQDVLVSGNNVKTINGKTILGSGNLDTNSLTSLDISYNGNGSISTIVEDGITKTFTYNANGTLNTVSWLIGPNTHTETYIYTNGALSSMIATED